MQKTLDDAMERKREALAAFLGVDPRSITESSGVLYSFRAFFHGNDEAYLVLTDTEATVAAEYAVQDKLWLISLECLFSYFNIDSYPTDVIGNLKTREIRQVNEEIKSLIYNSCGIDILRKKMLAFGNRKNLLADYDQAEYYQNGFFIYRLY
jgi:hypothetical protein